MKATGKKAYIMDQSNRTFGNLQAQPFAKLYKRSITGDMGDYEFRLPYHLIALMDDVTKGKIEEWSRLSDFTTMSETREG